MAEALRERCRRKLLRCPASGGYWGETPALAGCYPQGETVAELVENLREAAIGYLEVLRAEGRTPDPEVQILELAL